MCGNSGEASVHRRKQNTDRSTEDSDWKWLQLRRGAAARRSVPKNSASSGKAHLPGGEHSECGANSGEASVHRRKQNTDRSTEDSDWKWLQLRRAAAARRSVPKNSVSSGKAHLPGGEHSECGTNSGEASVHRRKQNTDRSTEGSDWKWLQLRQGAAARRSAPKKIAPAPDRLASPKKNIQNVWELRPSLRSPEETKHRPFDGGQRLEVF
jgi:hypothetical protein